MIWVILAAVGVAGAIDAVIRGDAVTAAICTAGTCACTHLAIEEL